MSSSLTMNSCQFHLCNSLFRAKLTRKLSSFPPGGVQLREEMFEKQTVQRCIPCQRAARPPLRRGDSDWSPRWTEADSPQIHPRPWELEQKGNPGGSDILSWWRTRINTNRIESGPVGARLRGGISGGSTQWPLLWVSNPEMSREARRIPCGSGLWQSASWNSDFALTLLSDGCNKSQMGELIRPFPWPGPL